MKDGGEEDSERQEEEEKEEQKEQADEGRGAHDAWASREEYLEAMLLRALPLPESTVLKMTTEVTRRSRCCSFFAIDKIDKVLMML